jgi:hypothetical protein
VLLLWAFLMYLYPTAPSSLVQFASNYSTMLQVSVAAVVGSTSTSSSSSSVVEQHSNFVDDDDSNHSTHPVVRSFHTNSRLAIIWNQLCPKKTICPRIFETTCNSPKKSGVPLISSQQQRHSSLSVRTTSMIDCVVLVTNAICSTLSSKALSLFSYFL